MWTPMTCPRELWRLARSYRAQASAVGQSHVTAQDGCTTVGVPLAVSIFTLRTQNVLWVRCHSRLRADKKGEQDFDRSIIS